MRSLTVDSRVEIHAECDAHVHLVGTTAGPIGADTIAAGENARLSVEGLAATIPLHGVVAGVGELRQDIVLARNAQLHLALPALIVTEDARVRALEQMNRAAPPIPSQRV